MHIDHKSNVSTLVASPTVSAESRGSDQTRKNMTNYTRHLKANIIFQLITFCVEDLK
jgi:hypothetical protein